MIGSRSLFSGLCLILLAVVVAKDEKKHSQHVARQRVFKVQNNGKDAPVSSEDRASADRVNRELFNSENENEIIRALATYRGGSFSPSSRGKVSVNDIATDDKVSLFTHLCHRFYRARE